MAENITTEILMQKIESLQAENERLNKTLETIGAFGAPKTTVEMADKIKALQSKLDRVREDCEKHYGPFDEILDLLK